MVQWGSVAIGERIGSRPDPEFHRCLRDLVRCGMRVDDVLLYPAKGGGLICGTNDLISEFLRSNCQSLLFLDDDVVFAPNALEQLRSIPTECHVLGAVLPCRRGMLHPIALRLNCDPAQVVQDCEGDVADVDCIGLGFTLFSRACLEAIRAAHPGRPICDWDNNLGEDGKLCAEALSCGFRVGAAFSVLVGHRVCATAYWDRARRVPRVEVDGLSAYTPRSSAA